MTEDPMIHRPTNEEINTWPEGPSSQLYAGHAVHLYDRPEHLVRLIVAMLQQQGTDASRMIQLFVPCVVDGYLDHVTAGYWRPDRPAHLVHIVLTDDAPEARWCGEIIGARARADVNLWAATMRQLLNMETEPLVHHLHALVHAVGKGIHTFARGSGVTLHD